MKVSDCFIEGVKIIEPIMYSDDRGFFFERYTQEGLKKSGINNLFIQDNVSFSKKGTLRGLHFQTLDAAQAKLIYVPYGKVFDVGVDLRIGSKTFMKYFAIELSGENMRAVFFPRGFAHGFYTLSDEAVMHYRIDNYYCKEKDGGIRYNDPQININWPDGIKKSLIVSEKDNSLPFLSAVDVSAIF